MKHEGKILEAYMAEKQVTGPELAGKLGISKQSVYTQLKNEKVSKSFKQRLTEIGISIDWSVVPFDENKGLEESVYEITINSLRQLNGALERALQAKEETISTLKSRIAELEKKTSKN